MEYLKGFLIGGALVVIGSLIGSLFVNNYNNVRAEGLEGCTLTDYVTVTTGRATPEPVYHCPGRVKDANTNNNSG